MSGGKRALLSLTKDELLSLLSKEEAKLSAELRELRNFHSAAWQEYGSELCAEEMLRKEETIGKKIAKIKKLRDIIEEKQLNGMMIEVVLADLQMLIRNENETITSSQKYKSLLEDELALFKELIQFVEPAK